MAATFDKLSAQIRAKDEAEMDLARQSGDSALYGNLPFFLKVEDVTNVRVGYYLSFVGSENLFLLITCTASFAFFITIPQYWLQLWTESSGSNTVFFCLWISIYIIHVVDLNKHSDVVGSS